MREKYVETLWMLGNKHCTSVSILRGNALLKSYMLQSFNQNNLSLADILFTADLLWEAGTENDKSDCLKDE